MSVPVEEPLSAPQAERFLVKRLIDVVCLVHADASVVRDRSLALSREIERLRAIADVAGDLWNELENLRDSWEPERVSLIEEYISRYESLGLL